MNYCDHAIALSELDRMNAIPGQDGVPLADSVSLDGFSVWHWYQDSIYESLRQGILYSPTPTHVSLRSSAIFIVLGGLLFLITIAAAISARLRGVRVMVFSVDRTTLNGKTDQRLAAVYDALARTQTPFVELWHSHHPKTSLGNLCKRRRLGAYLMAFDWCFWMGEGMWHRRMGKWSEESFAEFSDPLHAHRIAQNFYLRVPLSRGRVFLLEYFCVIAGIKFIVGIDDPRNYHEIACAAKRRQIPFVVVQHGHFTKYHIGWLERYPFALPRCIPDTLVVWSNYWKNELHRLHSVFSPERIVVGGAKQTTVVPGRSSMADGLIHLVVPFETGAPHSEVAPYLHALSMRDNVRIYFKLRPDESVEAQLAAYSLLPLPKNVEAVSFLPEGVRIDAVVGVYSTYLYDLIAAGIPAGVLETGCDFGSGLTDNGLAVPIRFPSLEEDIRLLAATTSEEVRRRQMQLCEPLDATLSTAIAGILLEHREQKN